MEVGRKGNLATGRRNFVGTITIENTTNVSYGQIYVLRAERGEGSRR